MTDDLIEAVARAIGDSADEMHVSQLRLAARAAIRAAAPLILDMAADHLGKLAYETPLGHENLQRGASTYNWLREHERLIRQLKERFQ